MAKIANKMKTPALSIAHKSDGAHAQCKAIQI